MSEGTSGGNARNALANETSPYLLQHAANPVEWYPWCDEALARARREDKPILLSVGYSACHWCHVMAHESFEHQPTAEVMNERFVNIKVDREERPDLDKIHQVAHQLLAQRPGGWPLTMFLAPEDLTPFFGGTYFPREPRHGMPAFRDVLVRVSEFYRDSRDAIRRQNGRLVEAMRSIEPEPAGEDPGSDPRPLAEARDLLARAFDARHGGFGGAPKFPHATNVERLLRHYAATAGNDRPDDEALSMAVLTLARMADGGIYDHVGGGFCRYSVDSEWTIPHFEKMLYDNGPLLALYVEAWQLTGEPRFRRVAEETAQWVVHEMQSPEGGYYSTLDADSEGEEGRFYLWTPDEVRSLLDDEEYRVVAARFGLDEPSNFEGRAWHLRVVRGHDETAEAAGVSPGDVARLLAGARVKLYETRSRRVWPARDEKVLTSWNALMIKGMAIAGRTLGDERWLDSAERALDFVRERLWDEGHLRATWKDGRARLDAYLDDYAFLIDALLAMLECRWRRADLELAVALADALLDRFEDPEDGGFFFTARDHEELFHRTKPMMDESLPSGNGIAAFVLARLGHLVGDTRYLEAAERTLRAGWRGIAQHPHAHNALLLALEEHLYPPQTIVLRGRDEPLARWHGRAATPYAPRRLALAIPADETDLPGLLAERVPREDVIAYVCRGHVCEAPITDEPAYEEALGPYEVSRMA